MFLYWDLKVLAQNLYLDSSVEASGQCTGERANGLDGTATTADDLSDVILGDRNLNRRGVVTIDDLKAHGIRVVDDLNNEIFDEIAITSVKRRCFNILRRQEKEMLEESSWFEQEQDAFYEFIDLSVVNELQSLIQEAIDELPPSYHQAFAMHRFQNKTRQEIAEALQVSIKTVDYRIQQSLKILRERLKDYLPILVIYGFML